MTQSDGDRCAEAPIDPRLEANKAAVVAFYDLAFNQRLPAQAAARYLGAHYRQHNQEAGDGAQGFVAFVSGFTQRFPQLRLHIKRVLAEGNFVVLHVHARTEPDDPGAVVIDIFRLEEGRIVEHWDAIQPIATHPAHANGLF